MQFFDIRNDPFQLPTISALVAFETAARLGSVSRAAKELRCSQPTISRQISNLEKQLSVRLFERTPAGVSLTDAGSRFREGVVRGLGIIEAAAVEAAAISGGERLVIAFPYRTSHLFMVPRYSALQKTLGEQVHIGILSHSGRNMPDRPHRSVADVAFTWDASGIAPQDRVAALKETVGPICSPGYATTHADILNGPVGGWSGLTFLRLTGSEKVWASWEDWFATVGHPELSPRFLNFDSYARILEMAAAGHGLALGCRGFIERFLETGTLVELAVGFFETGNAYYCMLTEKGRRNLLARKCLEFFERSA